MPPNTAQGPEDDDSHLLPHHHDHPDGMKRVDSSYWKEPHEATASDNYWEDPSIAHGKHVQQKEDDQAPPTHHAVPQGMTRVDSSYWKEPHESTASDAYWTDPAETHEKTNPNHHDAPQGMIRVGSYWKEEPYQETQQDCYWNDPSMAHGKHVVSTTTETTTSQHHAAPEGMIRVNSYWKEPHEATATDKYWTDPANSHALRVPNK